jgi:hypothetical protein
VDAAVAGDAWNAAAATEAAAVAEVARSKVRRLT